MRRLLLLLLEVHSSIVSILRVRVLLGHAVSSLVRPSVAQAVSVLLMNGWLLLLRQNLGAALRSAASLGLSIHDML